MTAGVNLGEIVEAPSECLLVHEQEIQQAVPDIGPGGQPHPAGHGIAVGGNDPDILQGLPGPSVHRDRYLGLGKAQGGGEGLQAEGQRSAQPLVLPPDVLDDDAADPGLALIDEIARAGLPVPIGEEGPAEVQTADKPGRDYLALPFDVPRQAEALGETVPGSDAYDPELDVRVDETAVAEKPVDRFLDRPVPPDGDDELGPAQDGFSGDGGGVEGQAGDEKRVASPQRIPESGQDPGSLLPCFSAPGRGVEDDVAPRVFHLGAPLHFHSPSPR